MAGTNTPANSQVMRMMRKSMSTPASGGKTSTPSASVHPSGGNPIGKAFDSSGDVDTPYMPYSGHFIGDSIAHGINTGIAKENEAKHHAASEAQQEKIQNGIDAYTKQLQQTGNPQTALLQTFGGDGHVHFDPDVFNAVMALHKSVGSGGAGNGQFQSQDLGHGLVGVAMPDGKYKVMPAHEAKDVQQKMQKGPNGMYGTFDPQTGDFKPVTVGGEAQQPAPGKTLATSKAQMDQLTDIQTVLDNVSKMKNAIGATGSLGYGAINRKLAISTGLGGPAAESYNAAYNDMAPALVRLTRVPGQSKMVAELAIDKLPKPGQATAFNIDQALPNIDYAMRQQVAGLYQTYKAENRVGGMMAAKQIAQTFDAHPALMQQIDAAKQALRTNPGQMTPDQVAVLQHESENGRLSYDDWTRTQRQRIQRGMVDPKTYDKYVAASPDLAQIKPEEHTDPKYVRAFGEGSSGVQEIPGANQAGPVPVQPTQGPGQQQPQGPAPQQGQVPGPQSQGQPQYPPNSIAARRPDLAAANAAAEAQYAKGPQGTTQGSAPPVAPQPQPTLQGGNAIGSPQSPAGAFQAPPATQAPPQAQQATQQPPQETSSAEQGQPQAQLGPIAQGAAYLYNQAGAAIAGLHSKLDKVLGLMGAGGTPSDSTLGADIDKAAQIAPDPRNQALIDQARKSAAGE